MKIISENRAFGGRQLVVSHESACCRGEMTFGLYLPPQAEAGRVPDSQVGRWFGRTIYDYLAGMTLDASIDRHRAEWRTALGLD